MRRYVDLALDSRNSSLEDLESMIEIALSMDYKVLGVKLDPRLGVRGPDLLKQLSGRLGADLVGRIDLEPRSKTRLLHDLRESRGLFGIVAVRTTSESLWRTAVHDNRVDLFSVSLKPSRIAFRPMLVKMLASTSKALEIEVSSLIRSKGQKRVGLLSRMRRWVSLARRFRIDLVVSSGAKDKYLLRSPLDQASLAQLVGMDPSEALDSISTVPQSVLERSRSRSDPLKISAGVRLVEGEKDACP